MHKCVCQNKPINEFIKMNLTTETNLRSIINMKQRVKPSVNYSIKIQKQLIYFYHTNAPFINKKVLKRL